MGGSETSGRDVPRNHDHQTKESGILTTKALEGALGETAKPIETESERRVLRKIDLFLMPAMMLGEHIRPNELCCATK